MPQHYKITFTPTAKQGLEKIHRYIVFELDAPPTWEKVFSGIISRCYDLSIFPESNTPVGRKHGYTVRRAHWKRYNIYYFVDSSSSEVVILNIIDSHRRYRPF